MVMFVYMYIPFLCIGGMFSLMMNSRLIMSLLNLQYFQHHLLSRILDTSAILINESLFVN